MLLISQNMKNYDLTLPKDVVFRINLAWCNSLEELEVKLAKNKKAEFFIDLPIGRIKPPNNNYSLEDINGSSDYYGNEISPDEFSGQVTLHYFGHQN